MPLKALNRFLSPKKSPSEFQIKVEKIIGFSVKSIEIYHSVFSLSKSKQLQYERLEYLGDSILSLVISEYLFDSKPNATEGYLTQMRSKLVSRNTLNQIGTHLQLSELIVTKRDKNLGKDINGNLLESLIGAIYKDKGLKFAQKFIQKSILNQFDISYLENQISSYKSYLYEWSQKEKFKLELNTFEEENAEEFTIFVCVVRLNNKIISKGRYTSKKAAEEMACKRAYYLIKNRK